MAWLIPSVTIRRGVDEMADDVQGFGTHLLRERVVGCGSFQRAKRLAVQDRKARTANELDIDQRAGWVQREHNFEVSTDSDALRIFRIGPFGHDPLLEPGQILQKARPTIVETDRLFGGG